MGNNEATAHRWADLDMDSPMDLIQRRRIIGKQAMVSHVTLEKGCSVPTHQHENEQFVCVLSGRIRFGLGDEDSPQRREVTLTGGGVLHLPANVPHSTDALDTTVVLDVFSPPSETTGINR